jgi:hypothetical protein
MARLHLQRTRAHSVVRGADTSLRSESQCSLVHQALLGSWNGLCLMAIWHEHTGDVLQARFVPIASPCQETSVW